MVSIKIIEEFSIENFLISNFISQGSFDGDLISIEGSSNTLFTFSNFELNNATFSTPRSIVYFNSPSNASLNLEKFDIQDIEIVDGTSIMSLGDIKTSSLHQLTFSNVFSSSLLDPTNYLINLERYAAGGNASFVMSDFQIDN